jgi:hypothetical protein
MIRKLPVQYDEDGLTSVHNQDFMIDKKFLKVMKQELKLPAKTTNGIGECIRA